MAAVPFTTSGLLTSSEFHAGSAFGLVEGLGARVVGTEARDLTAVAARTVLRPADKVLRQPHLVADGERLVAAPSIGVLAGAQTNQVSPRFQGIATSSSRSGRMCASREGMRG